MMEAYERKFECEESLRVFVFSTYRDIQMEREKVCEG